MKTLKAPSVSSPELAHWLYTVCVKLHLRDRQTKRRVSSVSSFVRPSACSFVSLSVVSVKGVHLMGGTNRNASQKFRRQTRHRNVQLLARPITAVPHRSLCTSVRLFVYLFMKFDTLDSKTVFPWLNKTSFRFSTVLTKKTAVSGFGLVTFTALNFY